MELSAGEVVVLRALAMGAEVEAQVAVRARIVLGAGQGLRRVEIAREVGVSVPTVDRWLARYCETGVAGLAGGVRGRPRGGRGAAKQQHFDRATEALSGAADRDRAAGAGGSRRVDGGHERPVNERSYEEPARALPIPPEGIRKGSQAVPRSVVERFVVVEAGPEAEVLRQEQTKATLNLLRWMADNPEPPAEG